MVSEMPAASCSRAWFSMLLLMLLAARPCMANENLYCGQGNCYDLLELERHAEQADVKKAYRRLALLWHPDKNRSPGAQERFRQISRAHEVLSDEKVRSAYDYFLDHPEDHFHTARYYHAVYAPKTPLWIVISGSLLFLSMLQYINQSWKYSAMMGAVRHQPSFKRRVNELLEAEIIAHKKLNKLERELLRDRVEQQVLDSEVSVGGSSFQKPSLSKLIGIRALLLPLSVSRSICEGCRWHWRFSVMGEAFGDEERSILTQRVLGVSQEAWEGLGEDERQALMSRELWRSEQFEDYVAEQQELLAQKRAQSGAYKRAKRWMKHRD